MDASRRGGAAVGWWRQAGTGLADLVLGERCAGCGETPGSWCSRCDLAVRGTPVVGEVDGVPFTAAGRYEGPLGRAVVAHKERGRLALVRPLGRLLADAVVGLPGQTVVLLVPVPSASAAVRSRGQDHAARLAAAAATELRRRGRGAFAVPGLRVVRDVRDQAGLSAAARRANVTGAFAPGRRADRLRGVRCVVVDDVVTTGSTLAAAVAAVSRAGGDVVGCAVVAAAGTQGPSGPHWSAPPRLA